MPIYRRVLSYYRPYWGRTAVATALMLGSIGFGLLKVWPSALIVGRVLPAALRGEETVAVPGLPPWPILRVVLLLCLAMVVFHLLGGVLNLFSNLIFVKVGLRALLRLRTDLYAYLHSLPLKFHDARRSSDSSFRVAYDSQSIQAFYSKGTFVLSSAITLAGTFAILWQLDRQIALLSLSIIPFTVATIHRYARRIRTESTAIQERESAVLMQAQEGLSSVKMVQAFGREEYEIEQFRWNARQSLDANLRLTGTSMKSALIVSTLMALSTAAMCLYSSASPCSDKRLSLDQLVAHWHLPRDALCTIWALTHTWRRGPGSAARAPRAAWKSSTPKDEGERLAPNARTIEPTAEGEIAFEKSASAGYAPGRLMCFHERLTCGLPDRRLLLWAAPARGQKHAAEFGAALSRSDRRTRAGRWRGRAIANQEIAAQSDQHYACEDTLLFS